MPELNTSKNRVVMSIVSHDQYNHVKNLIDSLEEKLLFNDIDLLIVITHNTETQKVVESNKFKIVNRYCLNVKGFGDNHNIVFENYKSNYFFVMNPDLLISHEFDLSTAISFLQKMNIDISSPQIFNQDGTIADYKRGNMSLVNLLKRWILSHSEETFQWYCGMFLIFKSSAFRKLNGFDPKYYMYLEDCDICLRARAADMIFEDLKHFSVIHCAQRGSRKYFKLFRVHVTSLIRFWLKI